ncbi:MAG TPA: TetR/AcrR family transcriptional regulator [Propionibacterium sp.]|nr:TetR/AcrR family transcriptional regulator [Propionibacterium sp.]
MRASDTREQLLDAAAKGFTESGFEATSISDLAAEVGIDESSAHELFESKQELWDVALERALERFDAAAQALDLDVADPVGAAADYRDLDHDHLADVAEKLFDFYLHEPAVVALRRMLALEQFRDPNAAKILRQRFIQRPLRYQETLFVRMFGVASGEGEHLALGFWGPIHLLLKLAQEDEPRARAVLRKHTKAFVAYLSGAENLLGPWTSPGSG